MRADRHETLRKERHHQLLRLHSKKPICLHTRVRLAEVQA